MLFEDFKYQINVLIFYMYLIYVSDTLDELNIWKKNTILP